LFAFFLYTFSDSRFKAHEDISWADHAVFVAFLSSAVFCLLCSAIFHTALSHSEQVRVLQPAMNTCMHETH
jgi:adiponectin receptor